MDLAIRLLQVFFGLVMAGGGAVWYASLEAGNAQGQVFGAVVGGVGLCFVLMAWLVHENRRLTTRV